MKRFHLYLLFFSTLATGCTPASHYSLSGGEILPGTQNNHNLIGGAFSVSPDGQFLFTTGYDPLVHPVTQDEVFNQSFLYDLERKIILKANITPEVASFIETYGLLAESGCWIEERIYISTAFKRSLFVDAGEQPLTWNTAIDKPCRSTSTEVPHAIEIKHDTNGAASIYHSGLQRLIATYEPLFMIGSKVIVSEVQISSDGSTLVYAVSRPFGSFVGNSEAYVVDVSRVDKQPILIASPVGTMRFTDDGKTLFAHVPDLAEDSQKWVIASWHVESLVKNRSSSPHKTDQ